MAEVFVNSGENSNNVVVPTPRLQGLFLPGIDDSRAIDGLGIVIPWGGGSTARKYSDYGISAEVSRWDTQLNDLSGALIPTTDGGISYSLEGLVGPQGDRGRDGRDGIIHIMGLNLPQNSNFLAALPHNLDLINDLGTAADKLIYTNAYNTYTELTWTERQPAGAANKSWFGVASDSDGSNLIAGIWNSRLYTSADSGVNWIERQPDGDTSKFWSSAASDSDGSNLIVGAESDRLYTSADSGASWTERQPAGDTNWSWQRVASDLDGSHLMAMKGGSLGRLYTSADSGASWTERQPAGDVNRQWFALASDSDGSHLMAGCDNASLGGRLYTSADSGGTWTERQPAGAANKLWYAAASDNDGSNLIAGVSYGRLYTSDNSGVTWTERRPNGVDENRQWWAAASDSDGSHLIAAESTGRIYISEDSGVTWTEIQPAGASDKQWRSVAIDSDGSNLMVATYSGRLYTGVTATLYSEATWAEAALTSAGRALLDDTTAAAQATTLGLGTGDSPTWVGATLSGLSVSSLVAADASKALESVTIGSSLTYTRPTLNAIQGIRTVDSPEFAGGTFTGVVTGVTPTAGVHLATKEYVDLALGAFKTFFLSDTASIVGSLNLAYPHETSGGQSTIANDGLNEEYGTGTHLHQGFITEAGEPATTTIHAGVIVIHFHAKKGASNQRITTLQAVISSVDADGSTGKTTIATSEVTAELTDTETNYTIHAVMGSDVEVASTARLICDVYANVTTGAQDSVVTLYMEGTEDSYFTTKVDSGIWQNHGDVLDDLNTLGVVASDGQFIVGTGAGVFAYESGATARTSLGLGTGDTPTFTQVILSTDPTLVTHAVPKAYADALVAGAFWEDVTVGTVANVDLSNGLEAGDTIDDYTLVEGDRVLVKEQTDQTENGLYVVPASGAASRAADANTAAEIEGKKCIPLNGSTTKHRLYFCITGDITLGVTDIKFAEVTQVSAHNTLSGIQGGQADQYYHLTSAEHTAVGALGATYQPLDTGLTNLAALGYVSDSMIKITAEDTYAIRTMAEVRTDLGLVIGTDVQAYDAELASLAALSYVAASFVKMTGANTFALRTIAETKTDLSLNLVENTALSTWAGTANITTLGTIATVGAITGQSTAEFEGASVTVGKASTTTGTLVLHDSNSANTITLTVPDITAGSLSFTLPPTDGANTNVLQTDGNGVLTWAAAGGTGFGRPMVFTPQCNEPPSANFATLDLRNYHPVLDFDATTNESAIFRGILPRGYASGGLTVYLHYAMTSAVADTVDWDVSFERIGDQQLDIDGDSFAAVNSVDNTTVPGTTGLVDVVSVAFTDGADMDSIAAGEAFRVKVTRDAASDDATGDAELLFVEIKET